jgi:hypothetical protein
VLLPLRNELRLRLGPQHRIAEVWSGLLFPRLAGETAQPGPSNAPIDELVATLSQAGVELPRRASVCVEDEYVYYTSLSGLGGWKEANEAAGAYFSDLLGDLDLLVDSTLSPCGTRWISAAIDASLVQGWRQSLEAHGVSLHSVHPALLEDLWALRPHVALDDGVLAMVRSEGVSLVAIAAGAVVDLAWERCDVDDFGVLSERIASGGAELLDADESQPLPVCLVASPQGDLEALRELAASRAWQLSEGLRRPAR